MYCVYYLCDPRDKICRYVGKTIKGKSNYRLYCHIHYSKKPNNNNHKQAWIKSLLKNNIKPIMIILEEFEKEEDAFEAEIFYISYLRYLGCQLTNTTDGGDCGPIYCGKENYFHKNKFIGENNHFYGKHHTEETKEKLRNRKCSANKPIGQYDLSWNLIKIFRTAREAQKETGVDRALIMRFCKAKFKKKQNHAGGYKWKYV